GYSKGDPLMKRFLLIVAALCVSATASLASSGIVSGKIAFKTTYGETGFANFWLYGSGNSGFGNFDYYVNWAGPGPYKTEIHFTRVVSFACTNNTGFGGKAAEVVGDGYWNGRAATIVVDFADNTLGLDVIAVRVYLNGVQVCGSVAFVIDGNISILCK